MNLAYPDSWDPNVNPKYMLANQFQPHWLFGGKGKDMASSSKHSPPYSSAAKIADSPCFSQYSDSLKCLEENNSNKSKCQQQFDVYKECKEKERQARLERNSKKSIFY